MLNPFSFQGRFSRKQFLLTVIGLGILDIIIAIIPVKEHEIVLGRYVKGSIGYATPAEPVTVVSWVLLCASLILGIVALWIMAAAIVKRLRDLGKNSKWFLRVIGLLIAMLLLQAVLPRIGVPILAVDVIAMILLLPAALIATIGMFSLVFLKGNTMSEQP